MSKVDAQRAMKSARHARAAAGAAAPSPAAAPEASRRPADAAPVVGSPADRSAVAAAPVAAVTAPVTAGGEPGMCGHRNMGGKACRRPGGHAEKSHRYT